MRSTAKVLASCFIGVLEQHPAALYTAVRNNHVGGGTNMPEYDYVCSDCGKEFAVFLSLKEVEAKPVVKCPHCQSDRVRKQITGFFAKTSKKS